MYFQDVSYNFLRHPQCTTREAVLGLEGTSMSKIKKIQIIRIQKTKVYYQVHLMAQFISAQLKPDQFKSTQLKPDQLSADRWLRFLPSPPPGTCWRARLQMRRSSCGTWPRENRLPRWGNTLTRYWEENTFESSLAGVCVRAVARGHWLDPNLRFSPRSRRWRSTPLRLRPCCQDHTISRWTPAVCLCLPLDILPFHIVGEACIFSLKLNLKLLRSFHTCFLGQWKVWRILTLYEVLNSHRSLCY